MSRSVAGKTAVATDAYAGSETAARLADYSGSQYHYISGRPSVVAESAMAMSDVANLSLPPDSVDSGSEKEASASKDHKTDNPGKDPSKVSLSVDHHPAVLESKVKVK